jgi:DNA modification methylase
MKAVGKIDKQRGHGRRHAGFNDRWDAMEKDEQCSGMRNKRSVWTVATQPFSEAHFATFPPSLIEPCILAGTPAGGVVLDPFGGAGTTGLVADRLQRDAILIELNPEYATMAERRIFNDAPLFAVDAA